MWTSTTVTLISATSIPASWVMASATAARTSAATRWSCSGYSATIVTDQRTVWLLREVSGQSHEEISRELGISATAVRGRLSRTRATVVERMQEWR